MAAPRNRNVTKPDPAFAHHVAVGPTNEEIEAKQAELDALREKHGYPQFTMGLSQEEKALDAWGDRDYDPLGARDPLEALKRQYKKEDFALKLLSGSVNTRLGTRDYRIVKAANGDPVRFGTMVLGEIPQKIADARRAKVVNDSNAELRTITDETEQNIARLESEARGMGLTLLKPGEVVRKNGVDHVMGITVERGEAPAGSD